MKIAVLGWGSLTWNRRNLQIKNNWKKDGPFLPIEFARISLDGRLTLVLYPPAQEVHSFWVHSVFQKLDYAKENLCTRENTNLDKIGFISIKDDRYNCQAAPAILSNIRDWANKRGLDAVIWTDLKSNFMRKTETDFTEENVIVYLCSLSREKLENAETYIRRAPKQISTKMRPLIEEKLAGLKGGAVTGSFENSTYLHKNKPNSLS